MSTPPGYEQARQTLADHRPNLDALLKALLEAETLDADAAYRAAGIPRRAREPEIVVQNVGPATPKGS